MNSAPVCVRFEGNKHISITSWSPWEFRLSIFCNVVTALPGFHWMLFKLCISMLFVYWLYKIFRALKNRINLKVTASKSRRKSLNLTFLLLKSVFNLPKSSSKIAITSSCIKLLLRQTYFIIRCLHSTLATCFLCVDNT